MVKTNTSSRKRGIDRPPLAFMPGSSGSGQRSDQMERRRYSIYVHVHFAFLQNFSVPRKKDVRVNE